MKRLAYFVVAAVLSGCAADPVVPPPPTPAERQAVLIEYMNCLVPHAKRLDDGQSDARTIAYAMRGACHRELDAVFQTATRADTAFVKNEVRRRGSEFEESSALQVVLNVRNSKTEKKP